MFDSFLMHFSMFSVWAVLKGGGGIPSWQDEMCVCVWWGGGGKGGEEGGDDSTKVSRVESWGGRGEQRSQS